MGSVRRRGAAWQADARVDGTRIRRAFRTRAEAEAFVEEHQARLDINGGLTVGRLLREWLATREAGMATSRRGPVTPGTIRNDLECIRQIEQSGLARVPAAQLTQRDIAAHYRARSATAVTTSINREIRALKAALRWGANGGGLIDSVPVELTGLSSVRNDMDPTTLSDAEVEKLLGACDPQLRALVALCRFAGIRRTEALTLQGRDVDLEGGVLHIQAKRIENGSRWSPKSRQRRRVPISPRLRDELERYLAQERGGQIDGTDWWFVRRTDGARLRDAEDRVRRAYRRAGIEPQGLHVLRRTWASRLAERGVNAETIRRMGGWSSLEVVQRSYFNVGEEAMRAAAELGD
jgi:integrase